MSTNLTINLERADSNDFYSRVILSPIQTPSVYSGSIVMSDPVIRDITPNSPTLTVNSLVPGIYEIRALGAFGGSGGQTTNQFYVQVPDLHGGTISAADCFVNLFPTGSFANTTASFAWTSSLAYFSEASLSASYAAFAALAQSSVSSSYAVTASYAMNGGGGGSYPNIYDVAGNVGISQPAPAYILDVAGNIGNSQNSNPNYISLDDGAGNQLFNAGSNFGFNQNVPAYTVDINGSLGNSVGNLTVASADSLYLSAGGYISVNNSSPSYQFDINATIGNSLGNLSLGSYDSITLVANSGYIGVNQTSPAYTLDVQGTVGNSSGNLTLAAISNSVYIQPNGGNVAIGNSNPQYTLDIKGIISDSSGNDLTLVGNNGNVDLFSSNSGGTVDLNFATWNGTGNCAINFYTYGNYGGSNGYGSSFTETPAATYTFTDRGNYGGLTVFATNASGDAAGDQINVMAVGCGGYQGLNSGVIIGADYINANNFNLPMNGLVVEGNVGIGTNLPQYQLDVSGTVGDSTNGSDNFITLDDGSQNMQLTAGEFINLTAVSGDIQLDTQGVQLTLDSSAEAVGINNISPVYPLDVNGDINFTGTIRSSGTPGVSVTIAYQKYPSGNGTLVFTNGILTSHT